VREKEEGHEEVAHFLKREREVRAEEREEEMRREGEEQAEEEHAQGRGGVEGQMLTSSTFGIEDLGPRTKEGLG
jgi:hypothetical protein